MFRHLSIAKKGLLVIGLPLIYQALLLGMLLKRQHDLASAQQAVVHTKDILAELDQVHMAMLSLQGSLRGYVITQLPDFEVESTATLARIPGLLAGLRALTVTSSPEQRARVETIAERVSQRVAWHEEVHHLIVDQGDWDAALARIRTLEGKQIMEGLQNAVEAFRSTAEELDRQRMERLQSATHLQDQLLIGGLILNVLFGLGATLLVGRSFTRRVDRLAENARRFTRGEQPLPQGTSHDELGQLDRTFHEMLGHLADGQRRERAFQVTLERRNLQLENANRDLDHKNQENEMFVYSVSHDLRSPLVNLQGFSKELGLSRDDLRKLLEKELDEKGRTRARKIVERDVSESIHYIQAAVMRLSSIIDALLRLSRAGRVDYQAETVDLQKVLARIIAALRGSLAAKGAEVEVGELPPAWGDPTALEQVFANLVGNAVNYLDPERPGRIEVGFCAEPPEGAKGLPTYFVRDNGLGIAEAYLPKVFAIFQRLHGNAAQGEGVGLTLVQRMVERHGGRIWVESTVGVGSTFFVALPVTAQSPLVVAPKKESVRLAPAPIPTT